jgi:hypothetical protein
MNKELKNKWLTALRSGEYKQAQGTLYDPLNDSYCCLGVLACVSNGGKGMAGVFGTNEKGHGGYTIAEEEFGQQVSCKLQTMNDGYEDIKRCSFDEIADYVEANL